MRQHLLTSDVHFPAYHKVVEHRNAIVIRSAIQLYPNPTSPIGVSVPYAQYVQHTFQRILQTISSPPKDDFPLTFRIADGLDVSVSHTVYNQLSTNTKTNVSYFIVSNLFRSHLALEHYYGKTTPLILLPIKYRFFFVPQKKMKTIFINS